MLSRWRFVVGGALVAACLAAVVLYQTTRPVAQPSSPRVFVPSPKFYQKLPSGWRVTAADAYWLYLIQYYGEHSRTDARFDSLPDLVDLVTALSPKWEKPYIFGAYALLDYERPDLSYKLMERGERALPGSWRLPFNLGIFAYWFGDKVLPAGSDKNAVAAAWVDQAARTAGRPDFVPRLAADLYGRGSDISRAIEWWGVVYAQGDKVQRPRAVKELDRLLPADLAARARALAPLRGVMSPDTFDALVFELMQG